MLAQRAVHPAARRLAFANPSVFSNAGLLQRTVTPASIASGHYTSYRSTATTTKPIPPNDAYAILAKQRLNRPVSPHLSIYRPQVTWYLSALNRITGSVLSGGLYAFSFLYLISPAFGWHLDSASLAAAFGSLPLLAKFSLKSLVAFPFTFHSFNGLRHFAWDMGTEMKNQQVINTGWTVVGLSAVSALVLALL